MGELNSPAAPAVYADTLNTVPLARSPLRQSLGPGLELMESVMTAAPEATFYAVFAAAQRELEEGKSQEPKTKRPRLVAHFPSTANRGESAGAGAGSEQRDAERGGAGEQDADVQRRLHHQGTQLRRQRLPRPCQRGGQRW